MHAAILALSTAPSPELGRSMKERIARRASRRRMHQVALQWRAAVRDRIDPDITDMLLSLAIAHRNFNRAH